MYGRMAGRNAKITDPTRNLGIYHYRRLSTLFARQRQDIYYYLCESSLLTNKWPPRINGGQ